MPWCKSSSNDRLKPHHRPLSNPPQGGPVPIDPLDIIKPGDVLLYQGTGLFGLIIQLKTWSKIGHCEVYVGDGYSIASRDGKGVATYPLRINNLIRILRPNRPFKLALAIAWYLTEAQGQKYDWLGLLRFTWGTDYCKGNTNNKQFCSEFLCRFFRSGGVDICNSCDADQIPPCFFDLSPVFDRIWSKV